MRMHSPGLPDVIITSHHLTVSATETALQEESLRL